MKPERLHRPSIALKAILLRLAVSILVVSTTAGCGGLGAGIDSGVPKAKNGGPATEPYRHVTSAARSILCL
jgi:hypothetical protein